jgi:pimeloyl-ACP methyl ester carboxylesterase
MPGNIIETIGYKSSFMPYFQTSKSSLAEPVNIYYEDSTRGKPVIFIHGWPLDSQMWEYQVNVLAGKGIRCITYDRRGFGKSDRPRHGYNYDVLASDLKSLIDELNVEKVTLVGFSMGGGEVARYIGRYGTEKIDKVVLISSVTPFMLQTGDNPDGLPQSQFDEMEEKIRDDRAGFGVSFGKMFYGVGLLSKPVSQAFLDWNQSIVMQASPHATMECLKSFSSTDFREDLGKINVPTFIVHGDSDKNVPIEISGRKTSGMIPGAVYNIYAGEPHGLFYTQRDSLNDQLLEFILDGQTYDLILEKTFEEEPFQDPLRMPNTGLI